MKMIAVLVMLCSLLFGFEYSDCCGDIAQMSIISKKPEPKFSASHSEKIEYKVSDEQIAEWKSGYMQKVMLENLKDDLEEEE